MPFSLAAAFKVSAKHNIETVRPIVFMCRIPLLFLAILIISSFSQKLVVAKRYHRVHLSCSARRHIRGQDRNGKQNDGGGQKRKRVNRRNSIEKATHRERDRYRDHQADGDTSACGPHGL